MSRDRGRDENLRSWAGKSLVILIRGQYNLNILACDYENAPLDVQFGPNGSES